jgi:RecA-family ATPase
MQFVVATLRRFARAADCSVLLVHHTGKSDGTRVTLGSARGASSVGGAVRSARGVSDLDKADLAHLNLQASEARDWFKVDDVKMSYAPRRPMPTYFRRVGVTVDGLSTPKIVVMAPDQQDDGSES